MHYGRIQGGYLTTFISKIGRFHAWLLSTVYKFSVGLRSELLEGHYRSLMKCYSSLSPHCQALEEDLNCHLQLSKCTEIHQILLYSAFCQKMCFVCLQRYDSEEGNKKLSNLALPVNYVAVNCLPKTAKIIPRICFAKI